LRLDLLFAAGATRSVMLQFFLPGSRVSAVRHFLCRAPAYRWVDENTPPGSLTAAPEISAAEI
jgi:hypothetical protein